MKLLLKSIKPKISYGRVIRLCITLGVFISLRHKIISPIKHILLKKCFEATKEVTHHSYNSNFINKALYNSYNRLIKRESRCSTEKLSICFILFSVCFTVRSSRPEMFSKKVALDISHDSQESTCTRASLLINLQG